jgi:hypothetical protein
MDDHYKRLLMVNILSRSSAKGDSRVYLDISINDCCSLMTASVAVDKMGRVFVAERGRVVMLSSIK